MDIQAAFKVAANVSGLDEIKKLQQGMDSTATSSGKLGNAGDNLVISLRNQLAVISQESVELQRYEAALLGASSAANPLIDAIERQKQAMKDTASATATAANQQKFLQGLKDQTELTGRTQSQILEYRAQQLGVTKDAQPLIQKLREAEVAAHSFGRVGAQSAKQYRAALATLPAQFTDIGTQLAGGQSPFLIMIQQGGQIRDSFGGVGNAFKAIGSMITPLRLAFGGVAIAAGTIAAAIWSGVKQTDELNRRLIATGGIAGQTAGSVRRLADEISAITTDKGEAKGIAIGAPSSGAFSSGIINQAVSAMAQVQRITGQSADKIVADFSRIKSGVADWATEQNRQYNFLTVSQYKHIKALEDQGKKEESMRLAMGLLTDKLAEREVQLNTLSSKWMTLKAMASEAWDAMANIGNKSDARDELMELGATHLEVAGQIAAAKKRMEFEGETPNAKNLITKLEEENKLRKARMKVLSDQYQQEQKAEAERAKKLAENQAKIDRINSGEAGRERNANIELELQQRQNYYNEEIRLVQTQIRNVEAAKRSGLMNEKDASNELRRLQLEDLDFREKAVQAEIGIEKKRSVGNKPADITAQAAKLLELQDKLKAVNNEIRGLKVEGAYGPVDTELKNYLAELGKNAAVAAFQLQNMRDKGEEASSTALAGVEFDFSAAGKFADYGEKSREYTEAMAQAQKTDSSNLAKAKLVAGKAYEEQTAQIELETRALTMSNDEKRIQQALLEMEQKGISDNTDAWQRRKDAIDASTAASRDWKVGAKQGWNEFADQANDVAGQTKNVMSNAFQGATDSLVTFINTGKANFKDFARSVMLDIQRMIVKQMVFNAISAGMGYFNFGSAASTGGGSFNIGRQGEFAQGGVFGSRQQFAFAQGGAMRRGIMGENGPEAIMPLTRTASGALGVRAESGGGGAGNVNITVNVDAGGGSEASGTGDVAMMQRLGGAIAQAVKQQINQEKRPGGALAGVR